MDIHTGKLDYKTVLIFLLLFTIAGCTDLGKIGTPTAAPTDTMRAITSTPSPMPVTTQTSPPEDQICPPASHHSVEVIERLPHDATAYTQGLLFKDGFFFESTGLLGESSIRKVNPATGEVIQIQPLASDLFGEGLVLVKDRFIQLTWKNNRALVFRRESLEQIGEFSYAGEGWGLTYDGSHIIKSNGTSSLQFLDPDSFVEDYRLTVLDGSTPVERINELEMVNGIILANIWQTNQIIAIEPQTGCISGWINLDTVVGEAAAQSDAEVLNGIAFDPDTSRLWVTGKRWSTVYEIKIHPELH